MSAATRNFAYLDGGRPVAEMVAETLAPQFSLVPGRRTRTLRRTWLDTFDWRLYRAGLTLESVTGRGPAELVLTAADGERITAAAGGTRWPAPAGALPRGPLRDRLERLTWVRALLPTATAASAVSEFRLCNPDGKTVAWLAVDRLHVTRPAAADLPPRFSVSAVRGCQGPAGQITRRLASQPQVQPGAATLDAVLATAGLAPGGYTGRVDVHLTTAMPARIALAEVLLRLLDTLEANVAGAAAGTDTEFLHDLRVAVRRTRTALKLGADLLPAGLAARYRPEFKWLADLTTPARDLDVHLLAIAAGAARLTSAAPADLAPFHDHLARRRAAEQRRLARGLRSARFTALATGWRTALTGVAPPARGPDAAHAAARIIRGAYRSSLAHGRAITPQSPPERVHDLRKRCKELRYALEFFAALHEPAAHRRAVRELKGLQDCLGTFQDCQVQQHEIRTSAAAMLSAGDVPATALLAMGDLAAHLGERERQARLEFASRFAVFASREAKARFLALTPGTAA
jgi:CHAD domain-containing protein